MCRHPWQSHSAGGPRQHDVTTMEVTDFDAERPRLRAIATRILGSEADADDVLQEAWLRLSGIDDIDDISAARLADDRRDAIVPGSPAQATNPGRGRGTQRPRTGEPGGRRRTGRHGGPGHAGRARHPCPCRAGGVRAARCLRVSVRRGQRGHGPLGYRRVPAGESGPAQGAGRTGARRDAGSAGREPPGRRRLPRRGPRRDLATLLLLLAPEAVMRADLVGQRMGTDPVYHGAPAVAARFNGVKGAVPVTIDGDLGGAWIVAGKVKVAFAFHVDAGLVREIELIADPDVLATVDMVRVSKEILRGRIPTDRCHSCGGPT